MEVANFTKDMWGRLVHCPTGYWAFVPRPLPPDLKASWDLAMANSHADRALAELAGVARNLPNPHLLIGPFIRREAVLSSRIEGTQASLSDLFIFEAANSVNPATDASPGDVREVSNYVRAMEYGLQRLEDFPLSLRLIRELHSKLMEGVRGKDKTPGEFRCSQNWIGAPNCSLLEATFVPPPVDEMKESLDAFEKYLYSTSIFPPLLRLALIHYQFEAIHPFQDGNGRVGRLLIPLLLCYEKLLPQPLLYLSVFFEKNRNEYYDLLFAVSQRGKWIEWINFFLAGVVEQSNDAVGRTKKLLELWKKYQTTCTAARSSALLLKLVECLFEFPVISIPRAQHLLGVTYRSAQRLIDKMVKAEILSEVPERKYNRLFVSRGILEIIEA